MNIEIHWLQILLGWLGGIPVTIIGQKLYHKYFGQKYFNVTYTEGNKTFSVEGEPPKTVNLESLIKTLFRYRKG